MFLPEVRWEDVRKTLQTSDSPDGLRGCLFRCDRSLQQSLETRADSEIESISVVANQGVALPCMMPTSPSMPSASPDRESVGKVSVRTGGSRHVPRCRDMPRSSGHCASTTVDPSGSVACSACLAGEFRACGSGESTCVRSSAQCVATRGPRSSETMPTAATERRSDRTSTGREGHS